MHAPSIRPLIIISDTVLTWDVVPTVWKGRGQASRGEKRGERVPRIHHSDAAESGSDHLKVSPGPE